MKRVDIAFIKHGDVVDEYLAVKGEAEWKMADSLKPYIQEFVETADGRPALIIGNDEQSKRLERENNILITQPTDKKRPYLISLIVRLWFALRTFLLLVSYRPKIVVVAGNFHNVFVPNLYSIFYKSKIVVVMTGLIGWEARRFLKRMLIKPFINILHKDRVGLILSRGYSAKKELKEYGFIDNNIKVFFPEYPDEFFTVFDIKEEFNREFELIFLGRFASDKGFMDLPEILRRLDDKRVRLNVIGWGFEEGLFKQKVAEYGLEKQVRIIGHKQSRYCYSYLSKADVLLVPTKQDTLCKVSIEGVLSCLPVVAYDIGGIKYNVIDGKTGFIIEPENIEAFVEAVKKIIYDKTLANSMRENAKADKSRFLNPENTFSKIVGDYIKTELG